MIKLSICIPTYNRSKFLRSNLLSIYNQLDVTDNSIEIIVSNNCSTDDTAEVVKPYLSNLNFFYHQQSENLGLVKNVLKVVNEYAKGDFCWIVGDDDFILPGALKNVLDILDANKDIDFIYAKIMQIDLAEYYKYNQPFHSGMISIDNTIKYKRIEKWEELLTPDYSLIFMGELMGAIFRREIWKSHQLSNIEHPFLSTLETSYPHSVIFANKFVGRKAVFLETTSIIALAGARDWWHKLGYILLIHVSDLLELYKSKGVSKPIMDKCYNHFIDLSMPSAVNFLLKKDKIKRDQINLSKYFKQMLALNAKMTLVKFCTDVCAHVKGKTIQYKNGVKRRVKALLKSKTEYELNIEAFESKNVQLPANFQVDGVITIINEGCITIGNYFKANSGANYNLIGGDTILRLITSKRTAKINIGNNVGISNSTLVAWENITIEDNVLIGGGVRIWDTNFHSLDATIRVSNYDYDVKTAPILIKENAFIGGGSIILKGVTIGKNSIIAAGSVVVKSIPDNVIAGGNPCRVIKKLI
jgi:acetyltransferase-like isoleucine patch superfamily enzyme/glycosyltransferase involved in cell wall biosynthesis